MTIYWPTFKCLSNCTATVFHHNTTFPKNVFEKTETYKQKEPNQNNSVLKVKL